MPMAVFPQDMPKANAQAFNGWSSLARKVKMFPLAWEAGIESHILCFPGQRPSCCLAVLSSFRLVKLQLVCLKWDAVNKRD